MYRAVPLTGTVSADGVPLLNVDGLKKEEKFILNTCTVTTMAMTIEDTKSRIRKPRRYAFLLVN